MGPNFRPYLCNVNDHLASIMVDLGLDPIEARPWLLWIWVYMQTPRPDGLSRGDEAPKLYEIEDALESQLQRDCGATFCGRITTENRREFYFYAETNEGFDKAVQAAMANFDGYKFDNGVKDDPQWTQYLEVLYPGAEDLERIKNGELLDVLTSEGDVLSIPRKVMHWVYFSSSDARSRFIEAVLNAGFKIESEVGVEGDRRFSACLFRVQSIEQEDIDDTVIQLLRLAQDFDGEYDGWETPVTTQRV